MYVTDLLEKTKLMSSQVALQQVSESLSSVKAALCHKPYQTMTAQICQSGHIVSKSISGHLALRTVTSYAQYRVCGVFLSSVRCRLSPGGPGDGVCRRCGGGGVR